MKLVVLRLACLVGAALSLVAVVEIARLPQESTDKTLTFLSWSALTAALVTAAGLVGLALAPAGVLERLTARGRVLAERLAERRLPAAGWPGMALLALGPLAYAVLLALFLPLNRAEIEDQWSYLHFARDDIAAHGGPAALVGRLYAGEFEDPNRNPLYTALLSLSPSFEGGKRLSAGIGMMTLIVLSCAVARRFGVLVAGTSGVLLATNFAYGHATTLVSCEGLMVLWSGLAWLASAAIVDRWSSRAEKAAGSVSVTAVLPFAGIGVLLALAYLTKASGIFLLVGFLVWLAARCLRRGGRASRRAGHTQGPTPADSGGDEAALPLRQRCRFLGAAAGAALAGWLIVSSPLLVRNARRFGNPLFNVNTYQLFSDRFDPEWTQPGSSTLKRAAQYFGKHSAGEIIWREARGMAWEAFILLRSLGPTPLDNGRAIVGVVLLFFCLLGMAAERRADAALVLLWVGIFWLFFAWYVPIAVGDRFVLPLVFPLLVYASGGILRLAHLLAQPRLTRFAPMALLGGLLWCIACLGATAGSGTLADRFPHEAQRSEGALRENG